jgi:hypothetical protein
MELNFTIKLLNKSTDNSTLIDNYNKLKEHQRPLNELKICDIREIERAGIETSVL